MNTIQITNDEGQIVNYTEEEVKNAFRLRKQHQELADSANDALRKVRNEVRDFFSEGEWSDGETTCNKGDVNDLLERIGASKLTTKYSGVFTITGTFNVEVEDESEIEEVISENTDISNWSADMNIDHIEVDDIEEDND